MRVLKTRTFARFARQESMLDEALANAIREAERGLVAAQLGGGLIKLRVARSGGGKSGGYRTIIAYSAGRRAVFLFGFAKNERDNLTAVELADLKMVGRDLLALTEPQIKKAVAAGQLQEVRYDEDVQEDEDD
jgi:hypothetical protein